MTRLSESMSTCTGLVTLPTALSNCDICFSSFYVVGHFSGNRTRKPNDAFQILSDVRTHRTRSYVSSVASSISLTLPYFLIPPQCRYFPVCSLVNSIHKRFVISFLLVRLTADVLHSLLKYVVRAKFRKATVSFAMSVRPSIILSAWKNSSPIGWNFMIFDT